VAFTNAPANATICGSCEARVLASVPCVNCHESIPLHPGEILGCVKAGCPARMWEQIYCPQCDMGIDHVDSQPVVGGRDFPGLSRMADRQVAKAVAIQKGVGARPSPAARLDCEEQ
jgi:hypothetical protein